MATRTHTTPRGVARRSRALSGGAHRPRRRSPAPLTRAEMRARLELLVERVLAMLDDLDGDPDLEPDAEGEAEPDEASAQHLPLSARRARCGRAIA
ncbi:hypothetical protein [Muricoccus radiodurans]|uniref:hypothetical protein n=1 Tax=Muricoccus radiodurans TaxID=2231721 RepID=UPI003CE88C6D